MMVLKGLQIQIHILVCIGEILLLRVQLFMIIRFNAKRQRKVLSITLEEGVGLTKNVSQQGFIINSPILWYATTTNIAENGTLTNVYSEIATSTLNYTSNNGS